MLLQKSTTTPNGYVLTHEEAGIVIRFFAHRFNETQRVTLLDDRDPDPATLARALREMGDWIAVNHPDKVFPLAPDQIHELNRSTRRRIGAQLRDARTAQHLTVSTLASLTGIPESQIHRIESGRLNASIDTLTTLASLLGQALTIQTP